MSEVECVVYAVAIFLLLKLMVDSETGTEGFGRDDKPFEPDNSTPMQNPWDNIDYIVPRFVM